MLGEMKIERDPVAEELAMQEAEIDTVRNRRCSRCGGPLDRFLTCDWCHERYIIEKGELIPRIEDLFKHLKPHMREFYQPNPR